MKLSIVIPCYNEEGILPLALERLKKLSNEWIPRDHLTEIEYFYEFLGKRKIQVNVQDSRL